MSESTSNQFADEEVQLSYTYPKGYKVKGITDQIDILRSHWPRLNPDGAIRYMREVYATLQLPSWVEGPFAIPRWDSTAPTYNWIVETVLALIASTRKFHNYRDGQLGAEYIRQHERSAAMWKKLGDQQKNSDILVVPAQFGLRHRGRSIRRAREVFTANEFGLGASAVGIMALTHPERLVQFEELHVHCAGDEFAPDAAGDFSHAPVFDFSDGRVKFFGSNVGRVKFFAFDVGYSDARYGTASAFVSQ